MLLASLLACTSAVPYEGAVSIYDWNSQRVGYVLPLSGSDDSELLTPTEASGAFSVASTIALDPIDADAWETWIAEDGSYNYLLHNPSRASSTSLTVPPCSGGELVTVLEAVEMPEAYDDESAAKSWGAVWRVGVTLAKQFAAAYLVNEISEHTDAFGLDEPTADTNACSAPGPIVSGPRCVDTVTCTMPCAYCPAGYEY